MLKNLTIGKKLALGFAMVLVLLVVVGVMSFRGVSGMGADAKDVISKNALIENITQKEIDHLNWANKVAAFLTDDNVTELTVQTDDHKCAFGEWLYGDARKEAEQAIPGLAALLKEIEGYHTTLHTSAISINEHFEQADAMLPGTIAGRQIDHLKWADAIRDAFLENKEAVNVQTDPTKCALGKWLNSEQAQKAHANGDADFKQSWDKMLDAHKHLHESAVSICTSFSEGDAGKAQAKKTFQEKTLPILHETMGHMDTLKQQAENGLVGMQKANAVFAGETKPSLEKMQQLLTEACHKVEAIVQETNTRTLASAKSTKLIISVLSVVAVVLGVVAAFFIARGITKALKRIIDALTEGAEQVASASGQVSSASQSLAEGATEQAAGLEETSSSLEEMSSMTKQNADNAQQANTLANEARKSAGTGAESMAKMNEAIQDIQKSSDETAKIIKVIDEIAFQTNLLALNAAVEAARAGEAGKGFAVVAEEVRNLAMRSAEAAKNTSSMIEESVKNSKNGVDIAGEVGKVLDEIVGSIGKTTDLVSEIAAASAEQAQGIDQVNTAVTQMDKVTQQNAANAEESASASEELSAQAEQMNQVVGELVMLVGGSATSQNVSKQGRSKRRTKGIEQTLNRSDHTFHQIAGSSGSKVERKATVKMAAEKAIPLGDNTDDFTEFNS